MTHPDTLTIPRAVVEQALKRAYQLGQTYWQQADSDSWTQNKKSDETQVHFNALVTKTCEALQPQAAEPKLYRLMRKDGAAWLPASEWMTEVDARWVKLTQDKPDEWRINEPLDGKKVADVFAKALQPQAAAEPVNAWQIFGMDGEPMFIQQDEASAKRYEDAGHTVKRLSYFTIPPATQAEPVEAFKKDAVFQASIDFIRELTGMEPPPIEVAPLDTFKPFKTFTDKVCSIFATPPATQADNWNEVEAYQAALTAALEALKHFKSAGYGNSTDYTRQHESFNLAAAAIAQIEALKGPTP